MDVQLYEKLSRKLGRDTTQQLMEYIENQSKDWVTKHFLAAELEKMRGEVQEVRRETAEAKGEMIKWLFVFWLSSVLSTIGGIAGLLKLAGVL